MEEKEKVITLSQVRLCRDEHIIFDNLSLSVDEGEFVYIVGNVGSGKSTLLKSLYGEIGIEQGEVSVLGYPLHKLRLKDLPKLRQRIGIIFQDLQLLQDKTAYDNLDIVLRAWGVKGSKAREERILEVLEEVGLHNKGYKYPHELSGGEQQRLSIARAILNRPKLILADEPTGHLDKASGLATVELLQRLALNYGTAVVMATHNLYVLEQFPARRISMEELRASEE